MLVYQRVMCFILFLHVKRCFVLESVRTCWSCWSEYHSEKKSSLLGKFLCTDMTLVSCWVHIKLVNVTAPLLLRLLVKLETYSVADAKSLSSIPIWDLVKKNLYHLVSSCQNNFQSRWFPWPRGPFWGPRPSGVVLQNLLEASRGAWNRGPKNHLNLSQLGRF